MKINSLIKIATRFEKRINKYQNKHDNAKSIKNKSRWGTKAGTTRECLNDVKLLMRNLDE